MWTLGITAVAIAVLIAGTPITASAATALPADHPAPPNEDTLAGTATSAWQKGEFQVSELRLRRHCRGGDIFARKRRKSCRKVSKSKPRTEVPKAVDAAPAARKRTNQRRAKKARPAVPVKKVAKRGSYRTICVRTCDGYYFPISFAAPRTRLKADAQKCTEQYPAGESVLFYHPSNGDPGRAVTITGDRYSDQPYAFRFRDAFNRHCAARLHQGLASLGRRVLDELGAPALAQMEAAAPDLPTASIPIPIARRALSSDPETASNRAGALTPQMAAIRVAGLAERTVGDLDYFISGNFGPPATVAGYEPPQLPDLVIPGRREWTVLAY